MSEADKSSDFYMYVYTIREMLTFRTQEFPEIEKLTSWLLSKSEQNFDGESVYYVISECIGKIFMLSSRVMKNNIKDAAKLPQNKRYIISNSLKFAFEDRNEVMES